MGASICNGVVAIARVVGTVGRDAADLLIRRDLTQKVEQHGRIADVVSGNLDRSDLERLFVDSKVDLAPDAPFGPTMIARVPLAFPLDFDAGAVDQKVQRALRASIGDVDGEGVLTTRQGAEIRHRPVQPYQPQQAFDETRRLPERHPEEHFHRQARLDSGITVGRLSATLAGGRSPPTHLWIEPYRQRPPALERVVICGQFVVL